VRAGLFAPSVARMGSGEPSVEWFRFSDHGDLGLPGRPGFGRRDFGDSMTSL